MKTQKSPQSKTRIRRALPKLILVIGIIAIAGTIIGLRLESSSSSPSSPAAIKAQKEFQSKLVAAQEEFQLEINTAFKAAALKTDSLLKEADLNSK